jgi:hypothetical protein
VIEYITIATTGNATNFGVLTLQRAALSACSSPTRGIFGGGERFSTYSNILDYVTIDTTGNAVDFGDLVAATQQLAACSNSHGGL